VSAGFNYVNNSETEVDFEFSAKDPNYLWMVNWLNTNPKRDPTAEHETYSYLHPFDSISGFHRYTYVWEPGKITFYVDGVQRAVHTTDVPSAIAYFMINHWGTNGPYWGGYADPNFPVRYYYIDSVRHTPLQ
jgi:beta-glucanase (GH16 family)